MFGALVLGGGLLMTSGGAEAEPVVPPPEQKDNTSSGATGEQTPTTVPSAKADLLKQTEKRRLEKTRPAKNCQLEFTLNKYSRQGVNSSKTCLDGKKDAEILKIIEEAKAQTCQSPFCGCWLG